jgi:prepilin-type processing-associated H-X9-DG protein
MLRFRFGGPRFGRPDQPNRPMPPLEIAPEEVPTANAIRAHLFPSLAALGVDDEGFQVVSREAITLAPLALAMAVPAAQSARVASRRVQSVNNLKQIGLALDNFHTLNNPWPPPAILSQDGKPLLSWRVAILPLLDQRALFNEFHLDEPWDSEHNQALVERMPNVYVVPGSRAEPGTTFYRTFSGKGTAFDPAIKAGVDVTKVLDGTSNTIAVVEAAAAVPWTKPDEEIPFDFHAQPDEENLIEKLGGHFPGGFNALFLDGSVRFIKSMVSPIVLHALITRDGGRADLARLLLNRVPTPLRGCLPGPRRHGPPVDPAPRSPRPWTTLRWDRSRSSGRRRIPN